MTRPAQANDHGDGDLRFYTHPVTGDVYPSVTTVLKVVSKPALVPWAAKVTAEYAVHHRDTWSNLGESAAIDLIKNEGRRTTAEASALGTAVHAVAELYAQTGTPPDPAHVLAEIESDVAPEAIVPHIEQYGDFLATWRPRILYTEATVYNHTFGYAGSLDLLADFRGLGRLVVDTKTGKGVYPEAALQQAAYANGEEIVTGSAADGWQVDPMPHVDGTAALHLRPESWKLLPLASGDEVFEAFVCATGLAEWQRDRAKAAVGKASPLPPPAGKPDAALLRRIAILTREAGMDDDARHAFVRDAVGRAGLTDCDDKELHLVELALRSAKLPLVDAHLVAPEP